MTPTMRRMVRVCAAAVWDETRAVERLGDKLRRQEDHQRLDSSRDPPGKPSFRDDLGDPIRPTPGHTLSPRTPELIDTPNSGENSSKLGELEPIWAKLQRIFVQFRPMLAKLHHIGARCFQSLARFGQHSLGSVYLASWLARFGQDSVESAHLAPCGQNPSNSSRRRMENVRRSSLGSHVQAMLQLASNGRRGGKAMSQLTSNGRRGGNRSGARTVRARPPRCALCK